MANINMIQIHLWRHRNKHDPPISIINEGRGRKSEGSLQKSWLEVQKWICKKCHPPPITKVISSKVVLNTIEENYCYFYFIFASYNHCTILHRLRRLLHKLRN